jgi:hypothetical protein
MKVLGGAGWGAALGSRSSFEEQFGTAALKNHSFGEYK